MQPIEEWLTLLPPVTRGYLVLAFITTVMCSLEVIGEVHLYFNFRQICQGQFWRLVTCFLYFAPFSASLLASSSTGENRNLRQHQHAGFDFVFQMYLLVRYFRSLEEGSFRGRSSAFLWMLLVGAAMMVSVAPFVKSRASMFLGPSLTFMVVYVWARRNQFVRLSLFGLFTFTAPYLPWVLVGLDMLLGASPVKDLLGIFAGHIYYFFEDVYPRMNNGFKLLATPSVLVTLFGETPPQAVEESANVAPADPVVEHAPARAEQAGIADRPIDNAPNEHAHID